eukprot:754264-Prymnesium_polylepis.1
MNSSHRSHNEMKACISSCPSVTSEASADARAARQCSRGGYPGAACGMPERRGSAAAIATAPGQGE